MFTFNLTDPMPGERNDAVLLDPKTHPIEAQELIRKIKDAL